MKQWDRDIQWYWSVFILFVLANFPTEVVGGQRRTWASCPPTCSPDLCRRLERLRHIPILVCSGRVKAQRQYRQMGKSRSEDILQARRFSGPKYTAIDILHAPIFSDTQKYKQKQMRTFSTKLNFRIFKQENYSRPYDTRRLKAEKPNVYRIDMNKNKSLPNITLLKHRLYRRSDTFESKPTDEVGIDNNPTTGPTPNTNENQNFISNNLDREDWTVIAIIISVVVVIFGISFSCALICAYVQSKHTKKVTMSVERNGINAIAEFYHESYV